MVITDAATLAFLAACSFTGGFLGQRIRLRSSVQREAERAAAALVQQCRMRECRHCPGLPFTPYPGLPLTPRS